MIFLSIPYQTAFAETQKIDIVPNSSIPGCEKLGVGQCYFPSRPTVKVGDKVTWKNNDSAAHTVTSGHSSSGPDGLFDSGLFFSGKSFSVIFNGEGSFPYFCMVHPWMTGKITVEKNPPQFHTMFLNVSPSTVTEGQTAEISGELVASVPISANEFVVRYKTNTGISGSQWVLDDGNFKMNVLWPVGVHEVRFYFDSEWGLIASNAVTLTVKEKEPARTIITLDSFRSSVTTNDGVVKFSGRLTTDQGAPLADKKVWVKAETSGRSISEFAYTDSNGYYSTQSKFNFNNEVLSGVWFVHSYFEQGTDFKATQSPKYSLSVTTYTPPSTTVAVQPSTSTTVSTPKSTPSTIETISSIKVVYTNFVVNYKIMGGKIASVIPDEEANSLRISLTSTYDGKLTITLPRELIDAKVYGQDDNFFVLIDGGEVQYEEEITSSYRTLNMAFPQGTSEIEIIGTAILPVKNNPYSSSSSSSSGTTSSPSSSTTSSSTNTFKSYANTGVDNTKSIKTNEKIPSKITLDKNYLPVYYGDVYFFKGKLDVGTGDKKGLTIIIKDHDAYGVNDELARGYVKSDGTFSIPWIARNTESGENLIAGTVTNEIATDVITAAAGTSSLGAGFLVGQGISFGMELGSEYFFAASDAYAVFEGNEKYLPSTSCGKSIVTEIDACNNTLQLEIIEPFGPGGKTARAFINSIPFGDYEKIYYLRPIELGRSAVKDAVWLPARADVQIKILDHASKIYKTNLADVYWDMKDASAIKQWRQAEDAYKTMNEKLTMAKGLKLQGELLLKQNNPESWYKLTKSIDLLKETWDDFDKISKHLSDASRIQYWK